jgi:hypothetical protein
MPTTYKRKTKVILTDKSKYQKSQERVRKTLDVVDNVLNCKDREAAKSLWDILTALRGPDNSDQTFSTKVATTCVIRSKSLPKTFNSHSTITKNSFISAIAISNNDSPRSLKSRSEFMYPYGHFLSHAKNAFKALGLKWDEVNYQKQEPGQ